MTRMLKKSGMGNVAAAAIDWWTSKRPIAYSEENHLANPVINCTTDSEGSLARAVATWLVDSEKTKRKKK